MEKRPEEGKILPFTSCKEPKGGGVGGREEGGAMCGSVVRVGECG